MKMNIRGSSFRDCAAQGRNAGQATDNAAGHSHSIVKCKRTVRVSDFFKTDEHVRLQQMMKFIRFKINLNKFVYLNGDNGNARQGQ